MANKLKVTVEPSEDKSVVLGFIILKFISDKFRVIKVELITARQEACLRMKKFYNMKNTSIIQYYRPMKPESQLNEKK